ncbi:alpha/beta hydrolase [Kribbella sandramycini]|uniref:Alpha/beta hydrolase n=1 Tax=Kribbella sandramycini TaxID=60450 RepID=A0A7Y4P1G5_9ACTN|nr:alpha/beta hydrolase [Kribbella sandramycini]MBB6570510.1 pimeloyl-ACP methyl ester carboxylesterase [Kribbella sandramycini]NOL43656.1 alpha/beta hydrolase [Kribbella sandramycini]
MHTFELNGTTQRYHVYGNGPVCIAHSGGPGVFWDYLRMPLLEEHLTMVYLEPIGTGGSERLPSHPNGYTRARYAEAVDTLIDHLGGEPVYLLGHSHGGFIAQYYALQHPERVTGVILYASAPVTGPEHGAEFTRHIDEFTARNADKPELPEILATVQALGSISSDAEMTAALRGIIPLYVADHWGRRAEFEPIQERVHGTYISGVDENGVPDQIDDRNALPGLRVPALVVVGRFDPICGVRWAEELAKLIPDAELVILERSGHFCHVEEPESFAAAITGFLTR